MTPEVTCKGGAIFFNAESGEHAEQGDAGATWFDNPNVDELKTQSYPSKYHSEDSYKAWLQKYSEAKHHCRSVARRHA